MKAAIILVALAAYAAPEPSGWATEVHPSYMWPEDWTEKLILQYRLEGWIGPPAFQWPASQAIDA